MIVELLAAAGLMAAPEWRHTPAFNDYPTFAVRARLSAAANLDLLISPEGRVIRCEVIETAGSKKLASEICALVKKRKLSPAKDVEGRVTYGLRREFIKLWLPGTTQGDKIGKMTENPAVEFAVSSLSSDDGSSIDLVVTAAVDEAGRIAACEFDEATDRADYAAAACAKLEQVQLDAITYDGMPIAYIRQIKVRFVVSP